MPKKYLEFVRGEKEYTLGGKEITVHSNGIKKLKSGDEGFLFDDSKLLLYDFITASKNRIAKNNADNALFSLLNVKKDKNIAGVGKIVKQSDKIDKNYTRIEYFTDGQQKFIDLENKFAESWVTSDPIIATQTANLIAWFSGAKIIKATATGYNPIFAVTNMIRDMSYVNLTQHGAYSNVMPLAYGQ